MCHSEFVLNSERLRAAGCRLVWLNSMTYVGAEEGILNERAPLFDAYVFESRHQQV